jgi:hypothetical protein
MISTYHDFGATYSVFGGARGFGWIGDNIIHQREQDEEG